MRRQLAKVSILIPTFNRANYLRMAIDSAIEQTYSNIEIIVLDDCSTDETVNVMRDYKNKKNLIFIRNDKNIGFIKNWNKGMELSTGEYIKIMGDDDLLDKNCITEQARILETSPDIGIVCCNYFIIDGNNKIMQEAGRYPYRLFKSDTKESGSDFTINYLLQKRAVGWPTAILFRRLDIKKAGFFDIDMGSPADIDMWCRILRFSNFYYIDKKLANCRLFPGNLSKKLSRHPFGYKDNMRFYFRTISYIEDKIDAHAKQIVWMNILRSIYRYYANSEGEERDIILSDLQLVARNLNFSNKMKFFLLLVKNFLQRGIVNTTKKSTK